LVTLPASTPQVQSSLLELLSNPHFSFQSRDYVSNNIAKLSLSSTLLPMSGLHFGPPFSRTLIRPLFPFPSTVFPNASRTPPSPEPTQPELLEHLMSP
jgi:hypothetical protein